MNDGLKQLLDLQEIDKVIDQMYLKLKELPQVINEKRNALKAGQDSLEDEKKQLLSAQLARRNKEMDLVTLEEKIRKHEGELNAVKSNDSYRALLNEIESAKRVKGEMEDEILRLMEGSDRLSESMKLMGVSVKNNGEQINQEISRIEDELKKIELSLEDQNKKRENFASLIPKDLLVRYNYIRERKKSIVIVPISGESCAGCNTNLTPSTMNEVRKGKELVVCDSCSRILYFQVSGDELPELPKLNESLRSGQDEPIKTAS